MHPIFLLSIVSAAPRESAAGSQAGPDTTAVLADLLEEMERAGRAMAAEAQRRGDSGSACERAYDSVKGS
ncbi:DUF2514 family protein [Pseudomonas sp. MS19]|nr:DUF2514 family protein [Pseudomonas sp. MS19]